jgi:hypothetical protein
MKLGRFQASASCSKTLLVEAIDSAGCGEAARDITWGMRWDMDVGESENKECRGECEGGGEGAAFMCSDSWDGSSGICEGTL